MHINKQSAIDNHPINGIKIPKWLRVNQDIWLNPLDMLISKVQSGSYSKTLAQIVINDQLIELPSLSEIRCFLKGKIPNDEMKGSGIIASALRLRRYLLKHDDYITLLEGLICVR